MARLLLLYDTDDRDFARDLADFLGAVDVGVEMIPRAPDGGTTLQAKEERFFEDVAGALFLITPGSERHGKKYPSPSVSDEMGQAKQRFKNEPWRVIYLVDSECNVQTVDQKAFIAFDRTSHRSIVEAMRRLIVALKDAALLAANVPPPPAPPPSVDIPALSAKLHDNHKKLLLALATRPSGVGFYQDFVQGAGTMVGNQADGNLLVQDLMKWGLVTYKEGATPGQQPVAFPSAIGWEVIRLERAKNRIADATTQQNRRNAEWPFEYRMLVGGTEEAIKHFTDGLSRLAGEYRMTRGMSSGSGFKSPWVDIHTRREVRPEDLDQLAVQSGVERSGKAAEVRNPSR